QCHTCAIAAALPHAHAVRWRPDLVQFTPADNREVEPDLVKRRGILAKRWQDHVAKHIRGQFHFSFARAGSSCSGAAVIRRGESERKSEAKTAIAQFDSS